MRLLPAAAKWQLHGNTQLVPLNDLRIRLERKNKTNNNLLLQLMAWPIPKLNIFRTEVQHVRTEYAGSVTQTNIIGLWN
jgi:hypothetical protein